MGLPDLLVCAGDPRPLLVRAVEMSHLGCIMLGSLKHRRFGSFGTDQTRAAVIKSRTVSTVSPDNGVRRVACGNHGGGAGRRATIIHLLRSSAKPRSMNNRG